MHALANDGDGTGGLAEGPEWLIDFCKQIPPLLLITIGALLI